MMIRVKVELLPGLRPVRDERKFEIELREGATVKKLLLAVGFKEKEVRYLWPWVRKNRAPLYTVLKNSDKVVVGVPLGGG
jgi:hypothetical protein